jgi:hypothetical protein
MTVLNIIFEFLNYIGLFFEFAFIPPFINQWDEHEKIETRERTRRTALKDIDALIEDVKQRNERSRLQGDLALEQLTETTEELGSIEQLLKTIPPNTRDHNLAKVQHQVLKTMYDGQFSTNRHRALLWSRNNIYLNTLNTHRNNLENGELGSNAIFDTQGFVSLLDSIKTAVEELEMHQDSQILASTYITGETITSESVLEGIKLYS